MAETAPQSDLRSLAARLRAGDLGLAAYLDERLAWIEAREAVLQTLLPEADRASRLAQEARLLEDRFPEPGSRPPLYGVLVGVKDIFRAEGFPTRAGSKLPPALFAGPEASLVTRVKKAGALVLGKTVTTEFAYFEPGPTRNPRNPEHTPGGSSSGSAAAVAAGFCALALGTQTVGSVIRPAAFCGAAGFKFSYGRVPLDGAVPYSPSLDHAGFFVPAAADLGLAVSVLLDAEEESVPGALVLGIPHGPYLEQAAPEGLAAFERQVEHLRAGGCTVVRVPIMEDIAAINERHRRLAAAEMAQVHAEWFAAHEERYRSRTAALIREGQTVSSGEQDAARASRLELRERLEGRMQSEGFDAWISPAAPGPAPRGLESTGDPCMNLPWTHAGLPVAAVPAGRAPDGLPLGLQCAGWCGRDSRLAALAARLAGELPAD